MAQFRSSGWKSSDGGLLVSKSHVIAGLLMRKVVMLQAAWTTSWYKYTILIHKLWPQRTNANQLHQNVITHTDDHHWWTRQI